MTTENTLPPCPLPDCEGGDHHYHDIDVYTVAETHDCAEAASIGYRCYGPHRPGLSEPIDLPEITDEMVERAAKTYIGTCMRTVLDEFRAELFAGVTRWQPIEHAQIRAGMRIRATVQCDDRTTIHVGVAHHQPVGTRVWFTEGLWPLYGWADSTTYEVDPATITDPDAELIEKIAKAILLAEEPGDEWGEDGTEDIYRKLARAALDAVRESDEAGDGR